MKNSKIPTIRILMFFSALLLSKLIGAEADVIFLNPDQSESLKPDSKLLTFQYECTNSSSNNVALEILKLSCGCMTAPQTRFIIPPGKTTSILINVDSTMMHSVEHKYAIVKEVHGSTNYTRLSATIIPYKNKP